VRVLAVGAALSILALGACSSATGAKPAKLDAGVDPDAVGEGLPRPVDAAAAARVAIIVTSCTMDMPAEFRLIDFYQRLSTPESSGDLRAFVDCLDARHTGCRALSECMAMTVAMGPNLTLCDGNVAQTSLGERTVRVDCSRLGKQCIVVGALADCIDAASEVCDEDAGRAAHCSADGRPSYCHGGRVASGLPCHTLGLECVGDEASGTFCAASAGACTSDASGRPLVVSYEGRRCVGDRLEACVGGGVTTVDCGTMVTGAACQSREDAGAFCGFGTDCTPGKAAATSCDGDSVVVCNGGRIERVDCRTMGFTSCVGRLSTFGEAYAACFDPGL
jgi:hypothetical protein